MKAARRVCLLNASRSCEPSGFLLQRVVNFLKVNGYAVSARPAGCSAIIVNSCCVTGSKRDESRALLEKALRARGRRPVILFGCLASLPGSGGDHPGLVRIGPKELGKFNDHFDWVVPMESVGAGKLEGRNFAAYQRGLRAGDHYVLIAQGCVNSCTFCSIRLAKGKVESLPEAEAAAAVKRAAAGGRRPVTLLADDCGSYGADLGGSLAGLLDAIAAAAPEAKLKLSTLHPAALLSQYSRLKPHFAAGRIIYLNVPLQSGSRRVLRLMGRRYDPAAVLRRVREIRRLAPGAWTYTHMIVGFPGETRRDFLLSLKASMSFHERMFIGYSDNPGTPAAGLKPKVEPEEIKKRLSAAGDLLGPDRPGIAVS